MKLNNDYRHMKLNDMNVRHHKTILVSHTFSSEKWVGNLEKIWTFFMV